MSRKVTISCDVCDGSAREGDPAVFVTLTANAQRGENLLLRPFPALLRRAANRRLDLCLSCARSELHLTTNVSPDANAVSKEIESRLLYRGSNADAELFHQIAIHAFGISGVEALYTLWWVLDDRVSIRDDIRSSVNALLETEDLTANISGLVTALVEKARSAAGL